MVEQFHGKEEVIGSTPIVSIPFSFFVLFNRFYFYLEWTLYLSFCRLILLELEKRELISFF